LEGRYRRSLRELVDIKEGIELEERREGVETLSKSELKNTL
jgi:hypothetical protein